MKKATAKLVLAIALACAGCCVCRRGVENFGVTKYGERAHVWTLVGPDGLSLRVTDYGCAVVGAYVPDGNGDWIDVVAGFDSAAELDAAPGFFGTIVGRFANRIAGGRFTLDGKEYRLEINDPVHNATCHSGNRAWHSVVWDAEPFERDGAAGIVFTREFPDGECGFPGRVKAKVVYTVSAGNVWRIEYEAETDRPTPVNLTNHAYWNLDGEGTICAHELQIAASAYLAVDENLIPVDGPPASVEGTPFDFRTMRPVGENADYDHNWCLDGESFRKAAVLRGKKLEMEVWTDQPGLQFYAGGTINTGWRISRNRPLLRNGYLALETQHWPDSPNRPDFASTILRPGETFRSATEYRFRPR
ncbi:MAG: galactose mutarotase [Kiritimatiellae bacterium]|nr:galactose mutarotase [Kiritimatiellia bacterium]